MMRIFGAAALALLCGCSVLTGGGPQAPRIPDLEQLRAALECSGRVEQSWGDEIDSVLVICSARNRSRQRLEFCGRFDLRGGYLPCDKCGGTGRLPVYYLLGSSWEAEAPLHCRAIRLPPGGTYCDTLRLTLRPDDFAEVPGRIELVGALWIGGAGMVFEHALCLQPDAIRVAWDVP